MAEIQGWEMLAELCLNLGQGGCTTLAMLLPYFLSLRHLAPLFLGSIPFGFFLSVFLLM